jgi:DNA-binding response OmpR family regulator
MMEQKKILIINDGADASMEVFREILSGCGYMVCMAYEDLAALKTARTIKPDAVLINLKSSDASDWTLCRNLRTLEDTRSAALIVLSSRVGMDHVYEAFKAGSDDYISKPFSPGELLTRLKRVLKRTGDANRRRGQ